MIRGPGEISIDLERDGCRGAGVDCDALAVGRIDAVPLLSWKEIAVSLPGGMPVMEKLSSASQRAERPKF